MNVEQSVPSLSILVAEDNRVNQLYIRTLLEKEGHAVTLANNGKEAYEQFLEGRFDLILMDVKMPDVDGLEAAARIRRYEKDRNLSPARIFALSAYDDLDTHLRTTDAQIDLFLSKPLDAETVHRALHQSFGGGAEKQQTGNFEDHDLSHYDYQKSLLREFADAEDTLISMLEMALQDIPVKMDTIEHTIQTGDSLSAAREAHSLANIVGVLHRPVERNAALIIEEKIEQGEWLDARIYFLDLKEQMNSLIHSIRTILLSSLTK
jgi:CheY-like chemotaxis protein